MLRRVLWAPMLPLFVLYGFVLLLAVLPAVCVVALLGCVLAAVGGWRLRWSMARAGRRATWDEVEREAAGGRGTLIVETHSMGWSDVRVWWEGESVEAAGGPPVPDESVDGGVEARVEDPAFDRWCVGRYTHREGGIGRLVECAYGGWGSRRVEARVRGVCGANRGVERVEVWSWCLEERGGSVKVGGCA